MENLYLGNTTYYGDGSLTQPEAKSAVVTVEDKALFISTFNVKPDGGSNPETTKKIDLLVYNRVNSNGKIVSSIVYIGDVVGSDITTSFMYRPKFMYNNSTYEKTIDIPSGTSNFSYFNMLRQSGTDRPSFLSNPTTIDIGVDSYPVSVINTRFPMLDGWYTLLSVGIVNEPTNNELVKVKAGQLVIRKDTYKAGDDVEIALVNNPYQDNEEHWHKLTEFTNEGAVINGACGTLLGVFLDDVRQESPGSDWYPLYAKQEFFVKQNFNSVYKQLMHNFISNYGMQYGEAFKQIRVKDRIIAAAALNQNFTEAQLFLQSTELIILEYTEL